MQTRALEGCEINWIARLAVSSAGRPTCKIEGQQEQVLPKCNQQRAGSQTYPANKVSCSSDRHIHLINQRHSASLKRSLARMRNQNDGGRPLVHWWPCP